MAAGAACQVVSIDFYTLCVACARGAPGLCFGIAPLSPHDRQLVEQRRPRLPPSVPCVAAWRLRTVALPLACFPCPVGGRSLARELARPDRGPVGGHSSAPVMVCSHSTTMRLGVAVRREPWATKRAQRVTGRGSEDTLSLAGEEGWSRVTGDGMNPVGGGHCRTTCGQERSEAEDGLGIARHLPAVLDACSLPPAQL